MLCYNIQRQRYNRAGSPDKNRVYKLKNKGHLGLPPRITSGVILALTSLFQVIHSSKDVGDSGDAFLEEFGYLWKRTENVDDEEIEFFKSNQESYVFQPTDDIDRYYITDIEHFFEESKKIRAVTKQQPVPYRSGTFSHVWCVKNLENGELYACKRIQKDAAFLKDVIRFKREISCAQRVRHENIIRYHEVFETKTEIIIIMDLCGKDLMQMMHEHKAEKVEKAKKTEKDAETEPLFTGDQIASIIKQIVHAVMCMHAADIGHLDLKPENIMIQMIDGKYVVKIIDFGSARTLAERQEVELIKPDFAGSPWYASPELRKNILSKENADSWGIGCILYVLLFRTVQGLQGGKFMGFTFKVDPTTRKRIMNGKILPVRPCTVAEAFVFTALSQDKDYRFQNVAEMLKHEFLSDLEK